MADGPPHDLQLTAWVAQVTAVAVAGGYFIYRALAGHVLAGTSIVLDGTRYSAPDHPEQDEIAIAITLERGENWATWLLSCKLFVKPSHPFGPQFSPMVLDLPTRPIEALDPESRAAIRRRNRFGLSPKEKMQLGVATRVPSGAPCEVEVVLRTKQWWWFRFAIAAAFSSKVFPPIQAATPKSSAS